MNRSTRHGSNCVPARAQLGNRRRLRQSLPIGAVVDHRVIGVGYRQNPGTQRNVDAPRHARMTIAPGEERVVVAHDRRQLAAAECRADDLDPDPFVIAHHFPFFRGKWAGFEQNGVRNTDLSNVVQHRGDLQDEALAGGDQVGGEGYAQIGDSSGVPPSSGRGIPGPKATR